MTTSEMQDRALEDLRLNAREPALSEALKDYVRSGLLTAYGVGILIGAAVCALASVVEISSQTLLLIFMALNLALIVLKWISPAVAVRMPLFFPMFGLILSLAAFLLTLGTTP